VLRAIGVADDRFEEDHLRVLRAVRFAARFGLRIEPKTYDAMGRAVSKLPRISPERIADELRAMLTVATRSPAARLLRALRLDDVCFRYSNFRAAEESAAHCVDAGATPIVIDRLRDAPEHFGLGLAALYVDWRLRRTHDTTPADLFSPDSAADARRAVRRALRPSNDEIDRLAEVLDFQPLLDWNRAALAPLKRWLARPGGADARTLLAAVESTGLLGEPASVALDAIDALRHAEIAPAPLATGDDLLALGHAPGPRFKRVLDATYDQQLEGALTTREQAIAYAHAMFDRGG
jgi:poly(A) polymerase